VVSVHNFSYGLLNPGLAFLMSCLGSFLGLRCVILSRAYQGAAKARWLILAAATIGAAVVMGIAVTGMHYTGMAALRVTGGLMSSMSIDGTTAASSVSGATAATFVIPLLLVISLATFLLTLSISLTPSEDEIRADSEIRRRLDYMEQRGTPNSRA